MKLPEGMAWWRGVPGGSEWLDRLPRLAAECAEEWSLELGEPFRGSNMALVVPAGRAVLKVGFPGGGTEREAEGLRHWAGRGAVTLLAHDPVRHALLVERCDPGTHLGRGEDDILRVAADLLRRLWRPPTAAARFPLLGDELGRWADDLPAQWDGLGRPFERALVDEAIAAVRELGAAQVGEVVLHGDFHSGNVLRAQREPWLVIDPIPVVGDRAFDAASLLRDHHWQVTSTTLTRRIDVLASELALDRERLRGWGIVQALFWGVSWAKLEDDMVLAARLLSA